MALRLILHLYPYSPISLHIHTPLEELGVESNYQSHDWETTARPPSRYMDLC